MKKILLNTGHVEKIVFNNELKHQSLCLNKKENSEEVLAATIKELAHQVGIGEDRYFVLTAPMDSIEPVILSLDNSVYDTAHFVGHMRIQTQIDKLKEISAPDLIVSALEKTKPVIGGITVYCLNHIDSTPMVIEFIDAGMYMNMFSDKFSDIVNAECSLDASEIAEIIRNEEAKFANEIGDTPLLTELVLGIQVIHIQITVSTLSVLDGIRFGSILEFAKSSMTIAPQILPERAKHYWTNIQNKLKMYLKR